MTETVAPKETQEDEDETQQGEQGGGEGQAYERDQVVKIINSVISKVEHVEEDQREIVYKELKNLKCVIDNARKEIGAASPRTISETHIPAAGEELDAVVAATAEATGTIMDCCDVINDTAAAIGGENGVTIEGEVMKIYEACSFQDVTGQRITKVVKTLTTIEEKIALLLDVIGNRLPGMDNETTEDEDTRTGDDRLLNGPQLPENAISQDEIDKLLAEFDQNITQ